MTDEQIVRAEQQGARQLCMNFWWIIWIPRSVGNQFSKLSLGEGKSAREAWADAAARIAARKEGK